MRHKISAVVILLLTELLIGCSKWDFSYSTYEIKESKIVEKAKEAFGEGDYRLTVNNAVDGKLQCTWDLNNPLGDGADILRTKKLFSYDFDKNEISLIKEIKGEVRVYDYICIKNCLYYSTVERTGYSYDEPYSWKVWKEDRNTRDGKRVLLEEGKTFDDLKTPVFGRKGDSVYYLSETLEDKNQYTCSYTKIQNGKLEKVFSYTGKMKDYYLAEDTWYFTDNELSRTGDKYSFVLHQKGNSTLFYYEREELLQENFEKMISFQYDLGDVVLLKFAGDDYISLFDKKTKKIKETTDRQTYYCGAYVSKNAIMAYAKNSTDATLLWSEKGELKSMKIEKPKNTLVRFYFVEENKILMGNGNDYYEVSLR